MIEQLRAMGVIREFESRLAGYATEGLIQGSTHPSVGMEAVAVGVCGALRRDDVIASTHRGHGHCLAKGAAPDRLLAEILGRRTGYSLGKGGSMHAASAELGILGTNGIVGASIGIATGAALAFTLRREDRVAVAFFGDGATNQGLFHEALNLAAIWSLPCVFVCENNHFAQSAAIEEMVAVDRLSRRADAYGMPGVDVDGMDVRAVAGAAADAVARAREGGGPTLLVADTWRFLGHMVGDTEIYRTAEQSDPWRAKDPIVRLAGELVGAGAATREQVDDTLAAARAEVDSAEATARAAAAPDRSAAFDDVYGEAVSA
jgi:acetoin:2,6-dichlorophenolindophenol oxidoreductase subunit alpha